MRLCLETQQQTFILKASTFQLSLNVKTTKNNGALMKRPNSQCRDCSSPSSTVFIIILNMQNLKSCKNICAWCVSFQFCTYSSCYSIKHFVSKVFFMCRCERCVYKLRNDLTSYSVWRSTWKNLIITTHGIYFYSELGLPGSRAAPVLFARLRLTLTSAGFLHESPC